jgi:hypothetical protein
MANMIGLGDDMAIEHAPASMPAGWYRDSDPANLRWWDGARWTDRVKAAVERPAPLYALNTPAVLGEPLHERNRLSAVALGVGVVGLAVVLALGAFSLTGAGLPRWALPVAALAVSVAALVLGILAGRRVEYTGEGHATTITALVLSGVLVLAGLAAAVTQFTLVTF